MLALVGGVFGLKLAGMYLSVSASVGFIALFGIGCSDNTTGPKDGSTTCSGNDDCPAGQVCDEGICQDVGGDDDPIPCTSDGDCRTDYSCQRLTRAPPPSEGQQPSFTNVCSGEL